MGGMTGETRLKSTSARRGLGGAAATSFRAESCSPADRIRPLRRGDDLGALSNVAPFQPTDHLGHCEPDNHSELVVNMTHLATAHAAHAAALAHGVDEIADRYVVTGR